MHLETSSNLFGVTVNPYNTTLTSGGSSGGEGALIGLRGSCLGIGTDIGGSIRSPAANNGLYGLRPTTYRLPTAGLDATMLYEEQIVPVIGPLSRSLEGIKMFMKAIIDTKPWLISPIDVPIPWRGDENFLEQDGKTKLKVGVIWDDGIVRPQPPVTRALREVVEKLKTLSGVEVVEWKPWKHDLAWEIIVSQFLSIPSALAKSCLCHSLVGSTSLLTVHKGKPILLRRRERRNGSNGGLRRASATIDGLHPQRQSVCEAPEHQRSLVMDGEERQVQGCIRKE